MSFAIPFFISMLTFCWRLISLDFFFYFAHSKIYYIQLNKLVSLASSSSIYSVQLFNSFSYFIYQTIEFFLRLYILCVRVSYTLSFFSLLLSVSFSQILCTFYNAVVIAVVVLHVFGLVTF